MLYGIRSKASYLLEQPSGSSEPSPQSSLPSQNFESATQWPLSHPSSESRHAGEPTYGVKDGVDNDDTDDDCPGTTGREKRNKETAAMAATVCPGCASRRLPRAVLLVTHPIPQARWRARWLRLRLQLRPRVWFTSLAALSYPCCPPSVLAGGRCFGYLCVDSTNRKKMLGISDVCSVYTNTLSKHI